MNQANEGNNKTTFSLVRDGFLETMFVAEDSRLLTELQKDKLE
jgi:hypothetical protein